VKKVAAPAVPALSKSAAAWAAQDVDNMTVKQLQVLLG
jgi:hypothetical protein